MSSSGPQQRRDTSPQAESPSHESLPSGDLDTEKWDVNDCYCPEARLYDLHGELSERNYDPDAIFSLDEEIRVFREAICMPTEPMPDGEWEAYLLKESNNDAKIRRFEGKKRITNKASRLLRAKMQAEAEMQSAEPALQPESDWAMELLGELIARRKKTAD